MGLQRLFEGLKWIGMTVRHCRLPNSAHRGSWESEDECADYQTLERAEFLHLGKVLEQMQADTGDLFWSGEVTCGFQKGSSLLQWLLGHLWQGERLLQLPIWLSSTRYLSKELTVSSSPQWESRRDPEWQPLSVHRKQPLTEGIHGEMDLLGARALQGAVLKRGCACGVCFFDWAVFVWEVSWECGWWLCNQLVQFHWTLSSWCLIESVSAVHCRSPWFWSFSCAVQWLVSKKMIESSPGDIFIIRRCILDQRPCPWTLPSIDGLVMEDVRQPTYLSANGYFQHLCPKVSTFHASSTTMTPSSLGHPTPVFVHFHWGWQRFFRYDRAHDLCQFVGIHTST